MSEHTWPVQFIANGELQNTTEREFRLTDEQINTVHELIQIMSENNAKPDNSKAFEDFLGMNVQESLNKLNIRGE